MSELILTIGLPASGKTYWATEFIKNHPNYVNVNRDDIRLMLQGRERYNKFSKWREGVVSTIQFSSAKHALLNGKSVIISDTNLNPSVQNKWRSFADNFYKNHGVDVTYKEQLFTDVHMGVCLERDKLREYPVGQRVIEDMFKKYQDMYWLKPKWDNNLPSAYIVDVDGTIADMDSRHPYQWEKVSEDLPKWDVIDIVNTLHDAGNKIIICSGRDGKARKDTIEWLNGHSVKFDYFYIREEGDSRKDTIIKEEIYNNHIKGKFNIRGVFDDRNSVTWMWRHLGLTCLQVNFGDF